MGDVRFTESANTPCDDGEVSRSPPRSTAVIGVAQRVHPEMKHVIGTSSAAASPVFTVSIPGLPE